MTVSIIGCPFQRMLKNSFMIHRASLKKTCRNHSSNCNILSDSIATFVAILNDCFQFMSHVHRSTVVTMYQHSAEVNLDFQCNENETLELTQALTREFYFVLLVHNRLLISFRHLFVTVQCIPHAFILVYWNMKTGEETLESRRTISEICQWNILAAYHHFLCMGSIHNNND